MPEHVRGAGPDDAPDILGLMRELDAMPARLVVSEWNSLQVSLYVYARNHQEAQAFAEYLINDASNEDLWHGRARRRFEQVHHETARMLQNHTASVESLLEHTDKIYQRLYAPSDTMTAYASQKQRFREDPLVSFMKCLRNILLHGESAKLVFRTSFTPSSHSHSFGLDRSFLDKHSNWLRGPASDYACAVVDYVDIPQLVHEYDAKVIAFMGWFVDEMFRVSDGEFRDFAAKERDLFLTQIGHWLDCWFRNPDPSTQLAPGDRMLFSGLFDEDDFQQLEQFPVGSAERGDKAVELLSARFEVPVDLQDKLRRAYADVNFFRTEELLGRDGSREASPNDSPS